MQNYKKYFSNKSFWATLLAGLVLLAASLVIQFFASRYATDSSSESVTDIILSNIRVYDVDAIFTWGSVVLMALCLFAGLKWINYLPFAMKSAAVFTLIRSIFVSLTHISPFPTHIIIDSAFFGSHFFNGIFSGNDLFFSGHTGLPFLLALMVWNVDKKLRYIFLGFSLVFAMVVLLGHLHYSIDVLAAYFITFTIFHICKFLFKKDWQLFNSKQYETL